MSKYTLTITKECLNVESTSKKVNSWLKPALKPQYVYILFRPPCHKKHACHNAKQRHQTIKFGSKQMWMNSMIKVSVWIGNKIEQAVTDYEYVQMWGSVDITLKHEEEWCREACWNRVNTLYTHKAWKQHAWGFHLHWDENGPPREEIKPFLTPPPLASSRPPIICPVNGLWVYSTAGSPQHSHK